MKKTMVYIRSSIKLFSLFVIAVIFILFFLIMVFKPTFKVKIQGEVVGYTKDKLELQTKIAEYMKGNGTEENVAFVQINELPEYELCLLKKEIVTNDEEIFNKIKESGINYYYFYAITDKGEEKAYVSTYDEAKAIVDKLKEKDSNNKETLGFVEKYSKEKKEFVSEEMAISKLYVEKPKVVEVAKTNSENTTKTEVTKTSQKKSLSVGFIRPISGTIMSRFGQRTRDYHSGLDIAASKGTPIKAAASGTVTFAGGDPTRSYGYYVKISHGNGIETLYAHCSKLQVSSGQKVSQGQVIANVGATGNASGNHLHLEIRVNGKAQNPQNYVY